MKKFLATILAFIYLSTSMGATLHLHYCMGKLISWGLIANNSKTCTFCKMPKDDSSKHSAVTKGGCCKDEQKQLKTEKDQKTTESALQLFKLFPVGTALGHVNLPVICTSSLVIEYPTTHAPPFTEKVPVFILNCIFRI